MKKNAIKNKNFDSVFHRLYLIPKQSRSFGTELKNIYLLFD